MHCAIVGTVPRIAGCVAFLVYRELTLDHLLCPELLLEIVTGAHQLSQVHGDIWCTLSIYVRGGFDEHLCSVVCQREWVYLGGGHGVRTLLGHHSHDLVSEIPSALQLDGYAVLDVKLRFLLFHIHLTDVHVVGVAVS